MKAVKNVLTSYMKRVFTREISYRDESSLSKSAFTCNRDETSSEDETRPRMKKFLFTREFLPGMKRVEFHPGMKFNLKENLIKFIILALYDQTSDDYFLRKVILFIIFVCLFSY